MAVHPPLSSPGGLELLVELPGLAVVHDLVDVASARGVVVVLHWFALLVSFLDYIIHDNPVSCQAFFPFPEKIFFPDPGPLSYAERSTFQRKSGS